ALTRRFGHRACRLPRGRGAVNEPRERSDPTREGADQKAGGEGRDDTGPRRPGTSRRLVDDIRVCRVVADAERHGFLERAEVGVQLAPDLRDRPAIGLGKTWVLLGHTPAGAWTRKTRTSGL